MLIENILDNATGKSWYEADGDVVSEEKAKELMVNQKAFNPETIQESLESINEKIFGSLVTTGDFAELGRYVALLFNEYASEEADGELYDTQRVINPDICTAADDDYRQRAKDARCA